MRDLTGVSVKYDTPQNITNLQSTASVQLLWWNTCSYRLLGWQFTVPLNAKSSPTEARHINHECMSLDYLHNKTACEISNESNVKQIQKIVSLVKAGFKPTLSLQWLIPAIMLLLVFLVGKICLVQQDFYFFIAVFFILF